MMSGTMTPAISTLLFPLIKRVLSTDSDWISRSCMRTWEIPSRPSLLFQLPLTNGRDRLRIFRGLILTILMATTSSMYHFSLLNSLSAFVYVNSSGYLFLGDFLTDIKTSGILRTSKRPSQTTPRLFHLESRPMVVTSSVSSCMVQAVQESQQCSITELFMPGNGLPLQ